MSPGDIHPSDCPEFEYNRHPNHATELPRRAARLAADLRTGRLDTLAAAADTRKVHEALFSGLTPPDYPYFAGHYRGEDFRCLRRYRVFIEGRPGWPAHGVPDRMAELGGYIRGIVAALDEGHKIPNSVIPPASKLLHTVQVACSIFSLVCLVHPYANGNGHAARFCVTALLVRYGYLLADWPIDPRPPDPPYSQLVREYQAGNHTPLEEHVLKCCRVGK